MPIKMGYIQVDGLYDINGNPVSLAGLATTLAQVAALSPGTGVFVNAAGALVSFPVLDTTPATPYVAGVPQYVFITTGAVAFAVTLPTAVGIAGRLYTFKKIDAGIGAVTITPNGAETIDLAANYSLAASQKYVTIISDGAVWWVVANN